MDHTLLFSQKKNQVFLLFQKKLYKLFIYPLSFLINHSLKKKNF